MKFLGIDYGTKKIGRALSDQNGKLAFPHSIIPTSDKETAIEKVLQRESIEGVVIGESVDQKGIANTVQEDIRDFAAYIGMQYGLPVYFEKELFTSAEARWSDKRGKSIATPHRHGKQTKSAVDDSAAALILQRYLDRLQLKDND